MTKREEAIELLIGMQGCWPKSFFQKINDFDHGIVFVCFFLYCKEEEVIAGDIAKEMQVSTARVATLLKKLEQKNYIRKHRAKEDARKTVVEITEEGRTFVETKKEEAVSKMEQLIDQIGKEELETCIGTLKKIGLIALD